MLSGPASLSEHPMCKKSSWVFCSDCKNKRLCSFRGKCDNPKPSPDKEVDKGWEILSYEFDNRIQIPNAEPYISLSNNFKDKQHTISRVKRLSDGVVFSVGDKVYYDDGGGSHANHWVIDHFYIRNDGVMLARGKDMEPVETIDKNCYLKHSPPPPIQEDKPVAQEFKGREDVPDWAKPMWDFFHNQK